MLLPTIFQQLDIALLQTPRHLCSSGSYAPSRSFSYSKDHFHITPLIINTATLIGTITQTLHIRVSFSYISRSLIYDIRRNLCNKLYHFHAGFPISDLFTDYLHGIRLRVNILVTRHF